MNSTNNPPLLIVGLGNPDPKYLKTRHNIGFWFLDLLAEKYNLSFNDNLKKGYLIVVQNLQKALKKDLKMHLLN